MNKIEKNVFSFWRACILDENNIGAARQNCQLYILSFEFKFKCILNEDNVGAHQNCQL